MIRAMRLAVVVTSLQGGLLQYAVQMADGLARTGHETDVLAPKGNELAHHTGPSRMRAVLTPPIRSVELPANKWRYLARRAAVAVRLTNAWAQINVHARRGGYDAVVIAEDASLLPSALATVALTVGARPRVGIVCHNVRPYNRWTPDGELFASDASLGPLRLVYPRCDVVFVHGEKSRAEFLETWPPAKELAVIPHGDERIYGDPPPPSSEERVLFFGDWRKIKGLDVLMEAFDRLVERRPAAKLTIAGTPAPADFDPELVRRWAAGHGDRVTVDDRYIPMEDVPALFAAARVVCTPYHVGYQSGVVHLAQTMARALVCSNTGDLPAAVGDGGLIVEPGDVPGLVDALERVLADPALAARLGAAGHERVTSGASWETVAEGVTAALSR